MQGSPQLLMVCPKPGTGPSLAPTPVTHLPPSLILVVSWTTLYLGSFEEGMCPGLNQVQDLVPDVYFHLPL